jgi:hypothetical protein
MQYAGQVCMSIISCREWLEMEYTQQVNNSKVGVFHPEMFIRIHRIKRVSLNTTMYALSYVYNSNLILKVRKYTQQIWGQIGNTAI